jgi:hypothetical protein
VDFKFETLRNRDNCGERGFGWGLSYLSPKLLCPRNFSHEQRSILKKLPVLAQPGSESEVDGLPLLNNSSLWTVAPGGIYFVSMESGRSVRFFDFTTKKIRDVFELDHDFGIGLSISPDGRWMIYSQIGDATSDIMLVDHFQ